MRRADSESHVQKLFLRNSSILRGFIAGLLPALDAVDDLLHEVFLTATLKAESFAPGTDFLAWTRAIARRKVMEHLRKQKKSPQQLSPEVLEILAEAAPEVDETFEPRRSALANCLGEVQGRSREILQLRYMEGLMPPRIAEKISWKVGAVNVALSRARRFLRDCTQRRLSAEDGD
jgi:RNA polymerase sigma-70 factor, ECF subfamily